MLIGIDSLTIVYHIKEGRSDMDLLSYIPIFDPSGIFLLVICPLPALSFSIIQANHNFSRDDLHSGVSGVLLS